MSSNGFPVPAGFTITTETCADYNSGGKKLPAGLMDEVAKNVKKTEQATGKKFGNAKKPLLLSVRSGAAVSMPGMMDTVLNLGLTDEIVEAMAQATTALPTTATAASSTCTATSSSACTTTTSKRPSRP